MSATLADDDGDSIDICGESLGDRSIRNTGQHASCGKRASRRNHASGGERRFRFGSYYGRDETNLTTRAIIGDCLTNQGGTYQPGDALGECSSETRAVDENNRPVRHCRLPERQSATNGDRSSDGEQVGFVARSVCIESQGSASIQRQAAGDSGASKAASSNREHPTIGEVSGKRRASRKVKHRSRINCARSEASMGAAQCIASCGESERLKVRVRVPGECDTGAANAERVCVCASVQRSESSRSEVERIVPFAEVDGDAGRGAPRRERHSIRAGQGQDIAAGDGAHDGDRIARSGTAITTGGLGFDSVHSPAARDRASGIDDNIRSGSCSCENADTASSTYRSDSDTRRSSACVEGIDAVASTTDCAASGDAEVADRAAIAEPSINASVGVSGDRGARDAD